MVWLDNLIAAIDRINPWLLTVFLYGISMIAYTIYRYRKDSHSTDIENRNLLRSFLGKKQSFETERTLAESIQISRVDEIHRMASKEDKERFYQEEMKDINLRGLSEERISEIKNNARRVADEKFKSLIKKKGDLLEDLTAEIYHILGYKAQTVREMKAQGKLQGLTGTDQGGDVIAELYNEKKELVERLMIQCKAYKFLDEENGNSAIQQAHAAKDYYGSKFNLPCDRAILITTSHRMTKPALDLANTLGVEIIDNDPTIDHNRVPKSKLVALIKKANAKLYQRSLKAS